MPGIRKREGAGSRFRPENGSDLPVFGPDSRPVFGADPRARSASANGVDFPLWRVAASKPISPVLRLTALPYRTRRARENRLAEDLAESRRRSALGVISGPSIADWRALAASGATHSPPQDRGSLVKWQDRG